METYTLKPKTRVRGGSIFFFLQILSIIFSQPKLRPIIKNFLDISLGQWMNSPLPSDSSFHGACSRLKVLASFMGLSFNFQSCWD